MKNVDTNNTSFIREMVCKYFYNTTDNIFNEFINNASY